MKYFRKLSVVEAADITRTKNKDLKLFKTACYRGINWALLKMTKEAARLGVTFKIDFKEDYLHGTRTT